MTDFANMFLCFFIALILLVGCWNFTTICYYLNSHSLGLAGLSYQEWSNFRNEFHFTRNWAHLWTFTLVVAICVQYVELRPGNFVDFETGEVVGHHKGDSVTASFQSCYSCSHQYLSSSSLPSCGLSNRHCRFHERPPYLSIFLLDERQLTNGC